MCVSAPMAAQPSADEVLRENRALLSQTAQAIEEFKTMNGGYPSSLDELEPPTYRVNSDTWGRRPLYKLSDDGISYALLSAGPDGREGTGDDILYGPARHARPSKPAPLGFAEKLRRKGKAARR